MFWQLIRFELNFLSKKPITWIAVIAFFMMGFSIGSMRNLPFAGIHRNAPYLIGYFTGVATLGTIFTITISVAQSFLKDHAANFEAILFTTPIRKYQYLGAQVGGVFFVVLLSFTFAMIGLIGGQYLPGHPPGELAQFRFSHYLWPVVVLSIPNILLCTAVTGSIALLTRSAISVYTGGLLIYVCYIAGSIISNSPLIATASPATPEAMSLVAKLDPFGLAAFFEQTRYWSISERNQRVIDLQGELLFNRLIYLLMSFIIIGLSYLKFSFRKTSRVSSATPAPSSELQPAKKYTPQKIDLSPLNWQLQSLRSLIKIDLRLVVKGIPFAIIMILLTALLVFELTSEIDAGVRNAARFADTPLMVTGILSTLPLIGSLVLLFYSNELLWKDYTSKTNGITTTNPVADSVFYFSKLGVLVIISLFMTCWSVLIGLLLQVAYDYPVIEVGAYSSLLYYILLPLSLLAVLLLFVQNTTGHKYLALVLSALAILLFNSRLGVSLGIRHPLLRFANTLDMPYLHMNGFGEYRIAFSWQMLNEVSIAVLLVTLTITGWNRNHERSFLRRLSVKKIKRRVAIPVLSLLLFLSTGCFIYYQASIKNRVQSSEEKFRWRERYERSFRKYAAMPQPSITTVTAAVDLFPSAHRYTVDGAYTLTNKTSDPIDSLLFYFDPNIHLENIFIPGGKLVLNDEQLKHQLFVLSTPLQPGDSLNCSYRFNSSWSPFTKHTAFNSIISNGTFIRMSRYFPLLGYQPDNEIDHPAERKRHGLPLAPDLKKATALETDASNFVHLDIIVSTEGDQTAIGSGELLRTWSENNRNYFHYKTGTSIPFRFAFSSARYLVRKAIHNGISIEVFYDPAHAQNVGRLLDNAGQTLTYASANFGPYPFGSIRFAEISDFATGFAATAYPSVIYMKEGMGFNADLRKHDEQDVINQLAGHELSHLWWGSAQLSPDQREGYGLMTETLAQYTELMLYRQAHGKQRSTDLVKVHQDLYLAARGYQPEVPLYRVDFESPYLIYNKGMVVMHQLELLVGERRVNNALAYFFNRHKFPNRPATSIDLLNAFYRFTPVATHAKIDELFKAVITYDAHWNTATFQTINKDSIEVNFSGALHKFKLLEDGRKLSLTSDSLVDIGLTNTSGKMEIFKVAVKANRFSGRIFTKDAPASITIDPLIKNLDESPGDNVHIF